MRRLTVLLIPLISVGVVLGAANAQSNARFSRHPAAGPPGTSITVTSITPCPANPPGVAGPRLVRVTLARGSVVLGSAQLSPGSSGAWSGTVFVSRSASRGAATLSAFCFSSAQAEGATLAYEPRTFTVTASRVTPAPAAQPVQALPHTTG